MQFAVSVLTPPCSPGLVVPGNAVSVARQFVRCTLHHLAPNGILTQLFMTDLQGSQRLAQLIQITDCSNTTVKTHC